METIKKKKHITMKSILLCLTLSMVIAGCGNDNGNVKGKEGNNQQGDKENNTSEVVKGEVKYPESFTYWSNLKAPDTSVVDKENNVKNKLSQITGTKVEYQYPPATGAPALTALNLMIATNTLPDVVETNWLDFGPDKLIQDETLLRLNELIEENAPNLTKLLNDNPEWKRAISTDEGNIYTMPFIREDISLRTFIGPVIRYDWLEKLGLEHPTTIEEWYTVLKAFKEQDPNGNNMNDEIPLVLPTSGGVTGAFGLPNGLATAWGINLSFYHVDNQVKFGPIEPEFKEFLNILRQWYAEGLLDKEFASMDKKLRDAKITQNTIGALVGYSGSDMAKLNGLAEKEHPEFKLGPALYPVLNEGDKSVIGMQDSLYKGYGAAISAKSKNPAEIVKWLDFMYSEEGKKLINFGIEGITYEMVDGTPTFTDNIIKNPDGLPMVEAKMKYGLMNGEGAYVQDKRTIQKGVFTTEQEKALEIWAKPTNERLLPIITQTADEDKEIKPIMNDATTYIEEMYVKFIMGMEPIENFDKYVSTLKSMGMEEAIALKQAALDRYNKR